MRIPRVLNELAELESDEAIDGRVAIHDSNHVEFKLDYRIGTGGQQSRYAVETYFFLPRSLGLNELNYGREQFYDDLQTYIRFKTPTIPLDLLADTTEPTSPLTHICRLTKELHSHPHSADAARKLRHELCMFGSVARAMIRDRVNALSAQVDELGESASRSALLANDLRVVGELFVDELGTLVDAWRKLRLQVTDKLLPLRVRDAYRLVDEYIGLAIELRLTAFVARIDRNGLGPDAIGELRSKARDRLMRERTYREGARYPTAMANADGGEELTYRRGVLKKFVTSVLWLEINKEREGTTVADIGAGVAAGLAMLFAILATILQTQWWMMNTSGFVIAAVITYILKDRIKDWLKVYFSRRLSRWLSDYNVSIRDPVTGAAMGRSRETFSHVALDRVPENIIKTRGRQTRSPGEIDAKPEIVFKYDKEILLENWAIIERLHLEDYDLNDITRFAMWRMLLRADDPTAKFPVYDVELDTVSEKTFRKVYHLHIVMVFHAGVGHEQTTDTRHLTVVFDKESIRRIEEA